MDRRDAIAWLGSACAVSLRQSQAKTLAALVQAAVFSRRVSAAYLLLIGVGLIANQRFDPSHWSSNRRSDSASPVTVGQWMLQTVGLRGLIQAVQRQLAQQVPNWGSVRRRSMQPDDDIESVANRRRHVHASVARASSG